jgi:DNA-binding beta-propeller fold protein YncE
MEAVMVRSNGWMVALFGLLAACVVGCEVETTDPDGGGGGEGGAGASGAGASGAGGAPEEGATLFVLSTQIGVAGIAGAETVTGTVEPRTLLAAGPDSGMYGPRDLTVTQAGALYVASENDASIVIYDADDTGVTSPARRLAGASTGISAPVSVAVDEAKDLLFVVNSGSTGATDTDVLVFEGAASIDGDVAPVRVMEPDLPSFAPLQIRARGDSLYAVAQTTNSSLIAVFDGASTADGLVTPTLTIERPDFSAAVSIFVEADGTIVAVDEEAEVFVFPAGATEPTAIFTIEGASRLAAAEGLDGGALFLADSSLNVVFALDEGLPAQAGAIAPSRSFDAVGLILPSRLAARP